MTPLPVLDLKNVVVDYGGRRGLMGRGAPFRAVDDVSLQVRKGDILGIVGESGSGKTTLVKTMLGLLKPTSGSVLLHGESVPALSRKRIADRVQFIFQDPFSSLNPRQTVAQIVGYPLYLRGEGSETDRKARVRELLDIVGLPTRFLDAMPGQMSGGQRQRVAIARALVTRPELLICDEPTSALDVSVQAQVLNLLLELRRDFGLTFVIVSHNMAVIQHMTTQVAVMYLGRVVEMARSEEVFGNPRHPYTRLLLDSTLTVKPGAGVPDLKVDTAARMAMRDHPPIIEPRTA